MKRFNTLVSRVSTDTNFLVNMCLRLLEKPKIMPFSIGKCCADYLARFLVNDYLCLYCVPLFLAGVPDFLPLFGRSIGVSAASINTTSYSMLL
jgi:hypothetical protein